MFPAVCSERAEHSTLLLRRLAGQRKGVVEEVSVNSNYFKQSGLSSEEATNVASKHWLLLGVQRVGQWLRECPCFAFRRAGASLPAIGSYWP